MSTQFDIHAPHPKPSPPRRDKIQRIHVDGLFDQYSHDIPINQKDRITFIYGPNGIGKTSILGIVQRFFNRPLISMLPLPFKSLLIETQNGHHLTTVRNQISSRDPASPRTHCDELRFTLNDNLLYNIDDDLAERVFNPNTISELFPHFIRVDYDEWLDRQTRARLDLNDFWEHYGTTLAEYTADEIPITPGWLQDFRSSITVDSLSIERLYSTNIQPIHEQPTRDVNRNVIDRTVNRYSNDLSNRIHDVLSNYGEQSQTLERSFLRRLMQHSSEPTMTLDALQSLWKDNEKKKSQLEDIGVLFQEEEQLDSDSISNFPEVNRPVLELYALDVQEKLQVFDLVFPNLNQLVRILRTLFTSKAVKVGRSGFQITSNNANLELRKLSSGEQHMLVLIYNLLFVAQPHSFIVIDEPELSLHVAWQTALLDALQKITALTQSQILIATHSPHIINDRWDLAVELAPSSQA